MGAPRFGHGAARGYSDVVIPYFIALFIGTTEEVMRQLEPSVVNVVGLVFVMFVFVGILDMISTVGRSKWWNMEYTFGYIIGAFFGFYTLGLMGASQDIMTIIGVMLIVIRLVEKIGRRL